MAERKVVLRCWGAGRNGMKQEKERCRVGLKWMRKSFADCETM